MVENVINKYILKGEACTHNVQKWKHTTVALNAAKQRTNNGVDVGLRS